MKKKMLKRNSSHTGRKVKVDGRVDKETGKWFWRNNEQEISTVGGQREPVANVENRQAWFHLYLLTSEK